LKEAKITIITPSYNSEKYIEECILSVLEQDYSNFEHIIIDGLSTDSTIDIVKKYDHIKYVSEPDEGLSNALNKGIHMATGDIICWLNSDDYFEKKILPKVNKIFYDNSDYSWLIGMTSRLYESNNIKVINKFSKINSKSIRTNCDYLRTMAAFYKKDIFKTIKFNEELHLVMDYQLYINILKKFGNPLNSEIPFTVFRVHSEQKTNVKNLKNQYIELLNIFCKEKLYLAFIRKTYRFIKIFFILSFKSLFTK
jgi:glycosyltransferase involved in cell wall biosynthesis